MEEGTKNNSKRLGLSTPSTYAKAARLRPAPAASLADSHDKARLQRLHLLAGTTGKAHPLLPPWDSLCKEAGTEEGLLPGSNTAQGPELGSSTEGRLRRLGFWAPVAVGEGAHECGGIGEARIPIPGGSRTDGLRSVGFHGDGNNSEGRRGS